MHQQILLISGHPGVWRLIASVKAQFDRVPHLSLEDDGRLRMILAQHREIVRSIAAHDVTAAERAMQAHPRTVFDAIERIAATHAEFFDQEQEIA